MKLTARDERFIQVLQERLGSKLKVAIQEVERDYGRAGVPRPGGEKRVAMYVTHHLGAHAKPGTWNWRRIWDYHTGANGWDTGGYNAVVDHRGELTLVVPPSRMTYGAGPKWNPITVHLCCLADHGDNEPSEEMLESIWQWLITCDDVLGYQPWRPHGAIRQTACPGGKLAPHIWTLAQRGSLDPRPTYYRD
jgi:hypothetical protein